MNRFIFSCLCVSSVAFAEVQSSWIDQHLSPYAGGENLLLLQKGIEKMEDSVFSISQTNLFNPMEAVPPNRLGTILRQCLISLPVSCAAALSQHEIFGHGYRVRDLGSEYATVLGYTMYVIKGSTSFDQTPKLTTSQLLSIEVAGVEANGILANQMRLKWLTNGQIDPRQYSLYWISALDFTQYTFMTDPPSQNPATTGNDIAAFLHYLKATYPDTSLNQIQLRNLSLISLLDPFLYFSLTSLHEYAETGRSMKIPMIEIGPVKYLPMARMALTPFGAQGFLEHYFQVNEGSPTYVYMKWGQNGANTYSGIGARNEALVRGKNGSLGFRMDFWHQPEVLFEQGLLSAEEVMNLPRGELVPQLYPDSVLQKKVFGAAFSLIGSYGRESWPARILLELGYKSAGYLPGEALRQAPIVRGGFAASF